MPKAIIFDLLTALLDSWSIWGRAANNDQQKGHEWRSRYLELTFGCGPYRPYEDLVQEAGRDVNLPSTAADALLSTWDQLDPWPEVPNILRRLKSLGYQLAIVTNCSTELGQRALSRCGAVDCIDAFASAEQAGFYKPRPEAYGHILAMLGIEPRDALFVAGSNGDVIGAADAGMDVVWHNRIGLQRLPGSAPLREGKSLGEALGGILGPQGLRRDEIATPALFLNRAVFERNCRRMHERAAALNAKFRVHIKTHKTVEGTEIEVRDGDGRIACSTLKEIEYVEPLIRRGIVRSVLYAIPPAKSHLQRLASLRRRLRTELILIIDHPSQIDLLDEVSFDTSPWPIFISVDCGDCREGIRLESGRLQSLIQHAVRSKTVYIYGFYTHAGHSYSVASQEEAQAHLRNEIEHVRAAADLCRGISSEQDSHLTLSVGATPTAHAAPITIDAESQQEGKDTNTTLELHAGNFAILDLQQTSTTLAPLSHIASWIEGEVLSVYPERRELLVNIGALGIGREPGREAGVWGFAKLVTPDCTGEGEGEGYSWNLVRLSQEHGVLTPRDPVVGVGDVQVGTRVRVLPQHACIAGAMHEAYLVVEEEEGVCVDDWVRCRGW